MTTDLATPTGVWRPLIMNDTAIQYPSATEDTPLETGWLASTPDGDNIVMDVTTAQAQAYRALAAVSGHAIRVEADLGLSMIDTGAATPFGNVASMR